MRRLTLLVSHCLSPPCSWPAAASARRSSARSGERKLELMLDWVPNPDHAGIYAAQGRGFFKNVGLDVADPPARRTRPRRSSRWRPAASTWRSRTSPRCCARATRGRRSSPSARSSREPLTSVISLPPNDVPNAAALRGKTVGTAGIDYQDAFLDAMLRRAWIDPSDVKRQNVGFDLQKALLTKRVDATLGGFENVEVVDLELKKRNPTHFTVDEAGIPPYNELVLVTSETTLNEKRDEIRSFLGALSRGTRLARARPGGRRRLPGPGQPRARPQAAARGHRSGRRSSSPAGQPFGYQDPAAWKRFAEFMKTSGVLKGEPDVEAAFTNDLLPGQGLE